MNMLSGISEKAKRTLVLLLVASMIFCGDISVYASPQPDAAGRVFASAALSENEQTSQDQVSGNVPAEETAEEDTVSNDETTQKPSDEVSENEISQNEVSENQVSENAVSENEIETEISQNEISENEISENRISENSVGNEAENNLAAPTKMKAVINKKNQVVITWKSVKRAKRYQISRRNSDGTWTQIGNTTAKKTVDSVDRTKAETYVYKIVPYGTDEFGMQGYGQPGYVVCTPTILKAEARTISDNDADYYIGVDYTTVKGAAEYEISHAYKKNKDYSVAAVVSNLNGTSRPPYYGNTVSSYNGVAAESYLDNGESVDGISLYPLLYKNYYYYKIRACVEVDGMKVYSDYSKPVKARVTVRAPKIYMAESVSYNSATIYWEDMSNIGEADSYYIYKSTKPHSGFKMAKKIKRWNIGSISMNVAGVNVNCLGYTLTGLKSETTYYFKVVGVKDKLAGAYSDALSATPVLTDVTGLSVNSANYDKIKISFNAVPGATKYYIYEAAGITDADGKVKPVSEWNFVNKPITCSTKPKNGRVTYTRSGLTHGTYYGYYVLPVRGKKHMTPLDKREYGYDYTRMTKPKVNADAAGLETIKVSWNKVSGATGYKLEYSKSPDFQTELSGSVPIFSKYSSNTTNKKAFTNRSYTLPVERGVKYYFRVTAYKFTKSEYIRNEYGLPGDPSDIVCEWGRPKAPKNLKAEFHDRRKGAALDWDKCTESDVKYYQVVRSIYSYNADKDKVGDLESREVLVDYSQKYTKTSYNDTDEIQNGKYVKYEVCGYYAPSGTSSSTWIEGKYASVIYMNPSKVKIPSKITVEVGGSVTPTVTFTPKASTNKELRWTIETSGGENYISLGTTGKIKGLKVTKSGKPIEIMVTSKNDYNVYATCEVTVVEKQVGKGNLVVCLDPGHGGSDSGASYGSLIEKNINLQTSLYTKERLEQYGVPVYMTRSSDTYVGLESRTEYAKSKGCNLFVSQHMNSGGGSGTEVYYSITQYGRKDLAAKISSKVSSSLGIGNRGARTRTGDNGDYYSVIRTSAAKGIPGLIVEGAFLDGDSGVAGNAKAIGYATADAILEYYGYK